MAEGIVVFTVTWHAKVMEKTWCLRNNVGITVGSNKLISEKGLMWMNMSKGKIGNSNSM